MQQNGYIFKDNTSLTYLIFSSKYTNVNPSNVYHESLQAVISLIQALTGMDFCDYERLNCNSETDGENVTKTLLKKILHKLANLLQHPIYNYITNLFLVICLPFKIVRQFIAFSIQEKLEFHVLIEYRAAQLGY